MKKKVVAVAALTAAIFALTGCSSGGNNSGDGGDASAQISLAHWGNQEEAKTIASMIAAFEKAHPKIKVQDQWLQGDYEQQVRVAIAGGTGPTVFQLSDQSTRSFASSLQPVSVDPSKYVDPKFADSMKALGKHYAVPFVAKPKVMAVNTSLFEKVGLPKPDANKPMSVDEFIADAKKLTSGTGKDKTFGAARLWFQGFLTVNDTWFFNKTGTKCEVGSSAVIKTADQVIAAENDGWAPTAADVEGQDMFDWLSIGRVAMQPDFGPWDVAKLAALKNPNIQLIPVPGGGEPMEVNGFGIGKYADANQTKAATELINFMSTDKRAQDLLTTKTSSLGVPIIQASIDGFKAVAPDINLQSFVNSMTQSSIPSAVPNQGKTLESFWNGANSRTQLGTGHESPNKVFPELQPGCQSALDKLLADEKKKG